jgi:hypothetical protein
MYRRGLVPRNEHRNYVLIVKLVPVPIAPILRIGSDGAEAIMRFCLIVIPRIHAETVGRPQLPVITIENVKTAAAAALARAVHGSRNSTVRGLRPADSAEATEQSANDPKPFGHAADPHLTRSVSFDQKHRKSSHARV